MKELIFTDSKFIVETQQAINRAAEAQQHLLNVWNSLNIGECTNLFQLIHDPYTVYRKATKNKTPVAGKYKVGEAFLEITDVMLPNELYTACRECKRAILTGHRDLWNIQDGKTVVLNQELADSLLHSHDIYVENEAQKEFVKHCINYVEAGEYLYQKLQTMVTMKGGFNVPFTMKATGFAFINSLQLEPEAMREMIKQL